jgi:hypothetical protein
LVFADSKASSSSHFSFSFLSLNSDWVAFSTKDSVFFLLLLLFFLIERGKGYKGWNRFGVVLLTFNSKPWAWVQSLESAGESRGAEDEEEA